MTQKEFDPNSFLLQQSSPFLNWKHLNLLTPVKKQGTCGSCYAFAVVSAIEAALKKQQGLNVTLSEQQIIDCSSDNIYQNSGCQGGNTKKAFKYAQNVGLTTDQEYPYIGKEQTCKPFQPYLKIRGYRFLDKGINRIRNALNTSPVTVNVESINWRHYKKGIFSDCTNKTDHAVLVVGIDHESIHIKNSWGSTWGEDGYIRLQLDNDICGMKSARQPIL